MFALFADTEKFSAENVSSGAVMVVPLTAPTDEMVIRKRGSSRLTGVSYAFIGVL
jgi:hypothetical protein